MSRVLLASAAATVLLVSTPQNSAAQTSFQAEVLGKMTRPDSPCPGGAFRCGEAFIDGYGLADWEFFFLGFVPLSDSCGEYVVNVTFTLADDSSLTLAETGTVCGPGKSLFPTPTFSWGNPDRASAEWQVIAGTGQFAAVTGGSGTNELQSNGARVRGTYIGILQD